MKYASPSFFAFVLVACGTIAACASGSDVPDFPSGGPGGNGGAGGSGGRGGAGGDDQACVSSCTTDQDCASTCPAAPNGSNCCDTQTNTCYVSNAQMCPGPMQPDGGMMMPPY